MSPYDPSNPQQPQQPGYPPPQQPGYPGQQPPRRSRAGLIGGIIGGVVLLCIVVCAVGIYAFRKSGASSSILLSAHATETARAPQPTPTAPAEAVIYHDTFTDTPSDWSNDSGCNFEADGYHVVGGHGCFAPFGVTPGDADIAVTVKAVTTGQNTSYGLVLRRTENNFYTFELTPSGQWAFIKWTNSSPTVIVQPTSDSSINTGSGASNDVRVLVVVSHFTFFVNGKQVGSADDSTFGGGDSGVVNDDSNATSEVIFTNFSISTPAA